MEYIKNNLSNPLWMVETKMHASINLKNLEGFESEDRGVEYLTTVRQSIHENGKFDGDILSLIDVLSQVLCDHYPVNRKLAMDLMCELIPLYSGDDLDSNIGLLFPQLLQNMLHHQLTIKKSALQVLHVYFRHSKDIGQVIDHLIVHGVLSNFKAVRNEVLVSLPALLSSGVSIQYIEKLVVGVLNCLNTIENGESMLPITLCLEHLKNIMGEDEFSLFLDKLDSNLVHVYHKAAKITWQNATHQSKPSIPSPTNILNFVPIEILENLAAEKSWQIRSDAVNELASHINVTMDGNSLKYHCRKILEYISVLAEDSNFNVALVSMNILHKIVMKAGDQSKIHLDIIIKILLKKLSDTNLIMRKINLRIALSLMHALSPAVFLKSILPLLKHKSSRVREQVVNMIIASLLSFPSSEFDLVTLPEIIGFTLLDSQKRVRHASLECFAILAQQLGPGNLSPLVSAVDILERKNKNADGLLLAVQSRLGRKMLPKINENEVVQYAVKLPTSRAMDGQLKPDVAWIIRDWNIHSGCKTNRSDLSEYAENGGGEKRILSAGRNKLPWEYYDGESKNARKSAPVRSTAVNHVARTPDPAAVICDSWVNDEATNRHNAKNTDMMPGTYFELYKNKMKKLKEAGLRADVQTVNMEVSSAMAHHSNSLEEDSFSDHEPKTSPVPVKPALARSASKKRADRMFEKKPDNLALNDANLSHTLPKMKGGLMHMISPTFNGQSPFPSRPTIHRAPSGTSSTRTSPRHHSSETSNLARLKSLSKSSPEGVNRVPVNPYQYNPEEPPPEFHKNVGDISYNRDTFQNHQSRRHHESMDSSGPVDARGSHVQPGTPKLAKSAQEKLRKLKEEARLSANKHREPIAPSLLVDDQQSFHKVNIEFNEKYQPTNNVVAPHAQQHQQSPREKRRSNSQSHKSKLTRINSKNNGQSPPNHTTDYNGDVNHHNYRGNDTADSSHNAVSHSPRGKKDKPHYKQPSPEPTDPDDRPIRPLPSSGQGFKNYNNNNNIDRTMQQPDNQATDPDNRQIKPSKHRAIQQQPENQATDDMDDRPIKPSKHRTIQQHPENQATDMDDRPIKPSKQPWTDRNGNIPSGNKNHYAENDVLMVEGYRHDVQHDVQKVHPKATNSPKLKRKPSRKPIATSPNAHEGKENAAVEIKSKHVNEAVGDINLDSMKPYEVVSMALNMLNSSAEDWEMKCDGVALLRRILEHQREFICEFHTVVSAILTEVKNLRSQVTRNALNCIADVFLYTPKLVEGELEAVLNTILPKAGDTNQFIRSDTEQAIVALVENVNPFKVMQVLISCGASHRNGNIRKVAAKAIADLASKIGYAKYCQHKMNVAVAAKLATDQQPDTRYHGRRILYLLLEHPDLLEMLKKQLNMANFKAVTGIVENLKSRGLEPASGSATLRRSTRGSPQTTRSKTRR